MNLCIGAVLMIAFPILARIIPNPVYAFWVGFLMCILLGIVQGAIATGIYRLAGPLPHKYISLINIG